MKFETDDDVEQYVKRKHDKIRVWVNTASLPAPGYDSERGWTLEELSLILVPDLVRKFRDALASVLNGSADRHEMIADDGFSPYPQFRWLELQTELTNTLRSALCGNRFRVEGLPPEEHAPIVVARVLLERMTPDIIVSELIETGTDARSARRFEGVRVFDTERTENSPAGRQPTYDWPSLGDRIANKGRRFKDMAELVTYCRENVQPMPGKRRSTDGPSDKTIREAVAKHRLREFIGPKLRNSPGN